MIGLGIETSCDDTSIAVLQDGTNVLSCKTFTQSELQAKYNGVVPELASRCHLEKINILLDEAIEESKLTFQDLNYVSVSSSPGLLGSLMIGTQMAKILSLCLKIPIIEVSHLEAHFAAIQLNKNQPEIHFPFLGLLLSGGNSSIYIVHDLGKIECIGDTLDDALGEAFDKVANLLLLPYPGGPSIEKYASLHIKQNETSYFPKLLKNDPKNKINFSFSGLKTSVLYYIKKNPNYDLNKLCYDFQETSFDLVKRNLLKAIQLTGIKTVIGAGGVFANETLRNQISEISREKKFQFYFPDKKKYCTDNGAMVGVLGYYLFKKGYSSKLSFPISSTRKEIVYEK